MPARAVSSRTAHLLDAEPGLRDPSATGPQVHARRASLLDGALVAIIGAGYEGKRPMYEHAHSLGVRLVVVDVAGSWAERLVDDGLAVAFVPVGEELLERGTDLDPLLEGLGPRGHFADAVVTFYEDFVVTAALVAERLGLPGSPVDAVRAARSKQLTRERLATAGLPMPRYARVERIDDLAAAAAAVGFPAVLKPEFGAAAVGCIRVDGPDELDAAWAAATSTVDPEFDAIFWQGSAMLLEQYLDGPEFDIEVLLSDGRPVYSAVSDGWPTQEPSFLETGLNIPTLQPPDVVAALEECAVASALALGLTTGDVHVEARWTSEGARLLEVNARIGGRRIFEFHRLVHGVDVLECHLLASMGVPIDPPRAAAPLAGIAEQLLQAPRSGVLVSTAALESLAAADVGVHVTAHAGSLVDGPEQPYPTVVAEVRVQADSVEAALERLADIVASVEIDIADVTGADLRDREEDLADA